MRYSIFCNLYKILSTLFIVRFVGLDSNHTWQFIQNHLALDYQQVLLPHATFMRMKLSLHDSITKLVMIKDPIWNKFFGVTIFKQLIPKTPLKLGSMKIKIDRLCIEELRRVDNEILKSDVCRFYGFIFSQLFAYGYLIFINSISVDVVMTILNIPMNLYPVLLQQMNRHRIFTLIDKRYRQNWTYSD